MPASGQPKRSARARAADSCQGNANGGPDKERYQEDASEQVFLTANLQLHLITYFTLLRRTILSGLDALRIELAAHDGARTFPGHVDQFGFRQRAGRIEGDVGRTKVGSTIEERKIPAVTFGEGKFSRLSGFFENHGAGTGIPGEFIGNSNIGIRELHVIYGRGGLGVVPAVA